MTFFGGPRPILCLVFFSKKKIRFFFTKKVYRLCFRLAPSRWLITPGCPFARHDVSSYLFIDLGFVCFSRQSIGISSGMFLSSRIGPDLQLPITVCACPAARDVQHSANDMRTWPQLLSKGTRLFSVDLFYLTHPECIRLSVVRSRHFFKLRIHRSMH